MTYSDDEYKSVEDIEPGDFVLGFGTVERKEPHPKTSEQTVLVFSGDETEVGMTRCAFDTVTRLFLDPDKKR